MSQNLEKLVRDLTQRVEKTEKEAAEKKAEVQALNERVLAAQAAAAEASERASAAESRLATVSTDVKKEVWEGRLRFAKKAGLEVQAFWLTDRRFLQQVGDTYEEMVYGAPESPVRVLLPKYIQRKVFKPLLDENKEVVRDKNGRIKRSGKFELVTMEHPEDDHLKIVEPTAPIDVRPGAKATLPPVAPPAGAQRVKKPGVSEAEARLADQ